MGTPGYNAYALVGEEIKSLQFAMKKHSIWKLYF